jgi:4'-phosphopantetheinyl transferase EntD
MVMVEPPTRSETSAPTPSSFDGLLVEGAVIAETRAPFHPSGLLPEEETLIATAVETRRLEFVAGRHCARLALGKLGLPPTAIGIGEFREPLFPKSVSGSITHTREYCAAAVVWTSAAVAIGIDAEFNQPLDRSVAELILSADERRMAPALGSACNFDALVFSIKEAFFKAFFPLCRRYLDFADAAVTLSSTDRSFRVRLIGAELTTILGRTQILGRYNFDSRHVYAAVSLLSP